MAVLHNEAKTLRLFVELVDREVPPVIPGQPPLSAEAIRVLGTAGVEFYDRRDQSFWPFIRLPVLYAAGSDGPELVHSIRELCALKTTGLVFRTGMQNELAIQIVRQNDTTFLVEVGIDLAPYLLETAGKQSEPGRELALFRFATRTSELVVFADLIKQELEKLPPVRKA
jgi:hypothetical protein